MPNALQHLQNHRTLGETTGKDWPSMAGKSSYQLPQTLWIPLQQRSHEWLKSEVTRKQNNLELLTCSSRACPDATVYFLSVVLAGCQQSTYEMVLQPRNVIAVLTYSEELLITYGNPLITLISSHIYCDRIQLSGSGPCRQCDRIVRRHDQHHLNRA